MAKLRIHELARQINKTNKEILDALAKNNLESNANVLLDDEQIAIVKKELGVTDQPVAAKKRITAVFRPQNSGQGGRTGKAGTQSGQKRSVKPADGTKASDGTKTGIVRKRRTETQEKKPVDTEKTLNEVKEVKETVAVKEVKEVKEAAEVKEIKEVKKAAEKPEGVQEAVKAETVKEDKAAESTTPEKTAEKTEPEKTVSEKEEPVKEEKAEPVLTAAEKLRETVAKIEEARRAEDAKKAEAARKADAARKAEAAKKAEETKKPETQRNYKKDGERPARNDRPFNRDGQPRGERTDRRQQDRPFNKDGQPRGERTDRRQQDRPFNRDGQQRSDRQQDRPFNKDGQKRNGEGYQDRRREGRPEFNKDSNYDRKPGERSQSRQNKDRNKSMSIPSVELVQKPSSKQKSKINSVKQNKYDKNDTEDGFGKKSGSKQVKMKNPVKPQPVKPEPEEEKVKVIVIPERLTLKELADAMKVQPSVIVKKLFLEGKVVTINQELDYETAEEIAMEFEVLCEKEVKVDVIEELLKDVEDDEKDLVPRPPVVCVMGHVDHGKTSLLDAIRSTNVISREAGGITQHIGAYTVEAKGQAITFLDTPGHEAFTAMRMRGAMSTDIAILVVAADDGVMPQTVEAINHAKAAGVEIIVAINKIDKPNANVERVKQELSEYELIPEDWGGSTIFVPVSAHTKEGIEELLEMILLAAEVLELKANPNRKARGIVIEAKLDKGKGPVATVLVQKGTLHVGDNVAAGSSFGKVRAMMDDKGNRVKTAGPSTPVEILGLSDVPNAGEVFVATENEKEARNFAETFINESKAKLIEDTKSKMSLDDLFSQIQAGNLKELNIIVKADVQGSVEAVKQSLVKLSNEEVVVKIIHAGVGAINESDVSLASASNAIIIGFNVRPDATAKSIAETEKVDVRLYKVIYQAIEDVEAAMKGMLDPVYEEKVIGHAIVRQTFKASGVGTIAGSYVTDGKFQRDCGIRITRENEQIYEGKLASLKRFKDDVKEVAKGFECGLVFEDFNDVKEEDYVEAFIMVEVPR